MDWISIKDKKPENRIEVLGYYKNPVNEKHMIYTVYVSDDKFMDDLWDVTDHLTHWMPLPKPPKN